MRLTIHISSKAKKTLEKCAAENGKDLAEYVSSILEDASAQANLNELLEPLRKQFELFAPNPQTP